MEIIYWVLDKCLPFSFMSFTFMKNAVTAVLLISPLMGMLGTMAVNNKMAFFSDALGHSALTGIALGVVFGIRNEMISMLAFGILMALVVTKVKSAQTASADAVISVFSSSAIALGLVILSAGGGFSKYSQYLIGDVLSITAGEILILTITLIIAFIIWAAIYNKLLLLSINRELAASSGVNVKLIENIFVVLVAAVVTVSIKWVGILLINSMLILPAAAARNIAKNSRGYLAFSVLIAVISGLSGLILSYYADASAGAAIVLVSAIIYFATYILRRKK